MKTELFNIRSERDRIACAIRQMESLYQSSMAYLQKDVSRLKAERQQDVRQAEEARLQMEQLTRSYQASTLKLSEELNRKDALVKELEQKLGIYEQAREAGDFFHTEIVQKIISATRKPRVLFDSEWNELMETAQEYYPTLMFDLHQHAGVTSQGVKVCLLVTICHRVEDVANLMGVGGSRVTNLKGDLTQALFGKREARSLVRLLAERYGTHVPI